ncbi:MAG: bifunctional hydroxymethylpyrimidine kinase/phosphomethylpyrimidine kinase [Chlorobi bacterium]|nr:bifunctional hydroxymethylpyrimidine kinase/phosphomethylpyrimidine kinase [Chlorobiota bacterium]MCI0717205.1 bifunctional hydroxymethylpyrimidine kinase/phosphomethylpyrimidine kinase [Chlorobiota bacterium]
MSRRICVLTIAGSDSGAGAGIQSDLKTFKNHGVYGLSVITAITAQNTRGVQKSYELPHNIIDAQLKSVFDDFEIKAVKTGMLSSDKVINTVVKHFNSKKNIKLVVDPVIVSKNGFPLLDKAGIKSLKSKLLPIVYFVTPNINEAEVLTGIKINSIDDLETAAIVIGELGAQNVLIKGGHLKKSIGLPLGTDVLFDGKKFHLFYANFVKTKNTHGIGCTLSAAIASNLASGKSLDKSIAEAKNYVLKSLKNSVKIGKGYSPVEQ